VTVGAGRCVVVDRAALDDALEVAASRMGRLSDDQVRALRRARRSAAAIPAVAAGVAALLFGGVDHLGDRTAGTVAQARVFATRAGERGIARLADGSTVRLNGATRVRVAFSDRRRSVELLAGQAFFDVRHDVTRPFVVRAGPGEARVLGTAFDLDLTGRQLTLAVHRGAVGFDAAGMPRGVVVRAGFRSRLRDGRVEVPTRFDPALPDWRQGWIDTDGMRLDDLVDELGRHGSVSVARPQGALAGITVAGRFRTDHPGDLLRAIGDGFGFAVREKDGVLTLMPAS